jgi:hypothetical protein
MLSVEGAQPIRPYEPPISIVWTRGEPCTDADCVLLTAALASGDARMIERGRWGPYDVILRWSHADEDLRYFLAAVRDGEPLDAT